MVQVKLLLVSAVLAVAALSAPVSCGVARRGHVSAEAVRAASASAEVGPYTEASSASSASSEEEQDHSGGSRALHAATEVKEGLDGPQDDDNEVLPPHPEETKMEPGPAFESQYKHGVAPAKLPAQETDNAHGYRHSIIHPYGDDIHA